MKKTRIYKNDQLVFEGTLYKASQFLGRASNYISLLISRGSKHKLDYRIYVDGIEIPKFKKVDFKNKIEVGMTFKFKGKDCLIKKITYLHEAQDILVDVRIDNDVDVFPFHELPTLNGLYKKIRKRYNHE